MSIRLETMVLAAALALAGCAANTEAVGAADGANEESRASAAVAALEAGGGAQCSSETPLHCPMRRIDAGDRHALAITSGGRVLTWGDNSDGQLGTGSSDPYSATPDTIRVIRPMAPAVAVAGGGAHSLMLDESSVVWAWGAGTRGQLGNGSSSSASTAVRVVLDRDMTTVVAIAAGGRHSVLLDSAGHVWTWGANDEGQLGIGSYVDQSLPRMVSPGSMGAVVAIAAGAEHTVALSARGLLWAWGRNLHGALGGATPPSSNVPVAVTRPEGMNGVVAVAAGAYHTLALANDGYVWAWGANGRGQLGNGAHADSATPVRVTRPTGMARPVALAAGGEHSLAITEESTPGGLVRLLWAWGSDASGQLGNGPPLAASDTPVQVVPAAGLTSPVAVAAGDAHSVSIDLLGELQSWGANTHGELGDGGTSGRDRGGPVRTSSLADACRTLPMCIRVGALGCAPSAAPDGTHCASLGVCVAGACQNTCNIAGALFGAGDVNPANPCQRCDPRSSTSGWTNVADGTSCNDGVACTRNDQCTAGACGGTAYTCTATVCQMASSCDGSGGCNVVPSASGTPCTDDMNPCTRDACDGSGSCGHAALPEGTVCAPGRVCSSTAACVEGCFIDGAFRAAGAAHPTNPCLVCTPASSATAWSPRTNGTSCNDGNPCTSGDVCTSGSCYGVSYECLPGVCQASSSCDGLGGCTVTPSPTLTPCADDGNACTADVCDGAGVCDHVVVPDGTPCGGPAELCYAGHCEVGCLIDGTAYASAAVNPADACEICRPGRSTTAWSPALDGSSCDDGDACTHSDECQAGLCGGTSYACTPSECQESSTCNGAGCDVVNKPDGTPCGVAGQFCEEGACVWPSEDAGSTGRDAAIAPPRDAAASPDAGAAIDGAVIDGGHGELLPEESENGCSCSVVGAGSTRAPAGLAFLSVAGLGLLVQRRRRWAR